MPPWQDGSYLAELLLSKGYEVHGIIRRASTFNTGRIQHLYADSRVGVILYIKAVGYSTVLIRITATPPYPPSFLLHIK